jgi:hypothetical protein
MILPYKIFFKNELILTFTAHPDRLADGYLKATIHATKRQ